MKLQKKREQWGKIGEILLGFGESKAKKGDFWGKIEKTSEKPERRDHGRGIGILGFSRPNGESI